MGVTHGVDLHWRYPNPEDPGPLQWVQGSGSSDGSRPTAAVWDAVAALPPLTTPSWSFLPFGLVSFTDRRFEPANFCFLGFSPGGALRPGLPNWEVSTPSLGRGRERAGGAGARAPKGILAFLRGQRGGRQGERPQSRRRGSPGWLSAVLSPPPSPKAGN